MQLCDAFDIPILALVDTPGNMVGPEAEFFLFLRDENGEDIPAAFDGGKIRFRADADDHSHGDSDDDSEGDLGDDDDDDSGPGGDDDPEFTAPGFPRAGTSGRERPVSASPAGADRLR